MVAFTFIFLGALLCWAALTGKGVTLIVAILTGKVLRPQSKQTDING
jgi:hypothetical protein